MTNWINRNKGLIIRLAFLVPIILVAIISISHVISWYDLANPLSWAIYLSIAIEIAAMSSIAAASVKVKGFSVWFVFIIVTLIQFIGNIYFCYAEIDVDSKQFKDWVELTQPIFEMIGSDLNNVLAQKRWLALLEGGLLPLISLTCLHFFIQYEDKPLVEPNVDSGNIETEPVEEKAEEIVEEIIQEVIQEAKEPLTQEIIEEIKEEIVEQLFENAIVEEAVELETENNSQPNIVEEKSEIEEIIEEVVSEKKTN